MEVFRFHRRCSIVVWVLIGCAFIYLTTTNHKFHNLRVFGKNSQESTQDSANSFVTSSAPEDSSSLPLRGPGDSKLPFQNKIAAQLQDPPKDIYVEKPVAKGSIDPKLKKILFWNEMVVEQGRAKHFDIGFGQAPFILGKCPINTCFTTSDRGLFKHDEIDALIWHFRSEDRSLPKVRSPHTRWVYWNIESPSYLFGDLRHYHGLFNWTFSYVLDSDFPYPYDVVYRRRKPLPEIDYQNTTSKKTKLAAWFVTNCNAVSKRHLFVKELQKFMQVDIYGRCGTMSCDCGGECALKQPDYCYEMVEREYKFYLAFENSLCKDYVTEKFFNTLRFNVVPVVYGFGNYSALGPPHSYINALDFGSAKELAEFLLKLDKDDKAYNEYFRWKRYHHFTSRWVRALTPWCELCKRLHTDNETKTSDLHTWYATDAHCQYSFEDARNFYIGKKT
ncbi:alpha-(1,3)-fucosyltransferase C-like [Macrobrachium nipponense]|uniref:alpha-(1,3)-fucosyltransferase C-like n=1 Tax=Macrobrachium nipponense TaxID=159736 RepID=UPI0030C83040